MATRGNNSARQSVAPQLESIRYLTAFQATIATGTIGGMLILKPMRVRGHSIGIGDTGTAGTTTVQVHLNGSAISAASLSMANTVADGTVANVGLDQALVAGDRLEIVVSAAATNGADLAVTVQVVEDDVQQ